MRFSVSLFRFKLPKGNIFSGKYRLVKRVTPKAVDTLRKQYELEEENMFYLRHPFLTREQSAGHAKALNKSYKWHRSHLIECAKKFEKHVTLMDELSHLKVSEDWDFGAGSDIICPEKKL